MHRMWWWWCRELRRATALSSKQVAIMGGGGGGWSIRDWICCAVCLLTVVSIPRADCGLDEEPTKDDRRRLTAEASELSGIENCPRMLHYVFEGYAPIGNKDAGNFTENAKATTLEECVRDCCLKGTSCHTAFMFNHTCYHVKCISNDLCLPAKKETSSALRMVLVNPLADGLAGEASSWWEVLKKVQEKRLLASGGPAAVAAAPAVRLPEDTDAEDNLFGKLTEMYNLANGGVSRAHGDEKYGLPAVEDMYRGPYKSLDYGAPGAGFEKYASNYIRDQYDEEAEESKYYTETKALGSMRPCDVTREDSCLRNEVCVRVVPNLRHGICTCPEGFERNEKEVCLSKDQLAEQHQQQIVPQMLSAQKLTMGNGDTDGELPPSPVRSSTTKELTVSVASKDVRLPTNEATLSAYVIPDEKTSGDRYNYLWTLVSQPKGDSNSTIADQTKSIAKLSGLAEGLYQFKVTVSGQNGSYGEAFMNITVLPEQKINKPPHAVITPANQPVRLPNHEAILDGSASSDDAKIVRWQWVLAQGPLGYQPELPEVSTLQLKDLTIAGNYTFNLTVVDEQGLSNSTTAIIQVLKEIDYPPEANAGKNEILYLPNNNVTLNGSLSKDDNGIVAWEWTKVSTNQSKAVDMQNTRTPFLQLSNLEEGVYAFELKVTDAKNQSSTSMVHVFVKPPTNRPPVAKAGTNGTTIYLPQTWAVLNGSESSDDIKIVAYSWQQISGPNTALIESANASIANATAMTIGDYVFELTVSDEANNNASDRVRITVVQEKNTPPVANAGGDQTVTLPTNVLVLNGSQSRDDLGIVRYSWTREPSSLALGTIIDGSDSKPALMLTNIVTGRYVFKLTVYDGQGLSASDTVSIIVRPDPLLMSLVEVTITTEATVLTAAELDSIEQKLTLLIGDNMAKLHVRELKVEPRTGQVVIVFYVEKQYGLEDKDKPQLMPALEVERILKEKFWRDYTILGTSVVGIRTTVCQNDCSGHGVCNAETRECICQSFWMPDIFYFWGIAEANCDWSILYVIVGVLIVFFVLSGICWGITCLCRRSAKPRTRPKPQKYSLLQTHDEELPSFNRAGTTISDSETDSDVLFESRSRQNGLLPGRSGNGGLPNGELRNGAGGHPKYGVTRLGRRIKA
ncbi:dyslexia-associated protein KIAA0319-like protein [Anopheles merus]|uniref:MANSC domain-containing protein n=1 Tax=Anopheles merus TaxID=30066 RepID=A0A182V249_ANOME|nr:dyslexia-associated protein KIAA0319-like protein [Anopheles merus]